MLGKIKSYGKEKKDELREKLARLSTSGYL
jgi:hypothetical protein